MAEPGSRRGFSLIEALVAVAVLAVVLSGALAAAGGSLGVAERARRDLAMATLAETLLERAGLDLLVGTTVEEGTSGGWRWRLERVAQAGADDGAPSAGVRSSDQRRPRLWRIAARVEDGSGAGIELATLRLEVAR